MNILRESSYRAVPWKNGGGVTREILRAPAEPDAFDWRLSLATVPKTQLIRRHVRFRSEVLLGRQPAGSGHHAEHSWMVFPKLLRCRPLISRLRCFWR